MRRKTRFWAITLTLGLLSSTAGTQPAHAYGYLPEGEELSRGKVAVLIDEMASFSHSLVTNNKARTKSEGALKFCSSLDSESCTANDKSDLSIASILPVCENLAEACIEGVNISRNGGPFLAAKEIRKFGGISFPSNPQYKTQRGATASVWQTADSSGSMTKIVVSPVLLQTLKAGKLQTEDLYTEISAIEDWQNPKFMAPHLVSYNFDGDIVPLVETGDFTTGQCAAIDDGYCAKKVDFPSNIRISLTLQLPNEITGWLHGRLKNSSISVQTIDSKFNRVTVSAEPVLVPQMYAVVDTAKATTTMKKNLEFWNTRGGVNGQKTWQVYPSTSWVSNYLIKNLAKTAKDTAISTKTIWSFYTLNSQDFNYNRCLNSKTKLVGLVSTNAMSYSGAAPTWSGGMLNYEVAGLHYLPDGETLTEGTYDLAIRSEAARCLYGFSKAPISASISVIGSKGEKKVATTTVSEKNGWLKLAAYGFTFSAPKIRVKLTQKKR